MTKRKAASIFISLNSAEDGSVPEWVQLLPKGPEIVGRDGRSWTIDDPYQVIAASFSQASEIVFDFEHATEVKGVNGDPAPATGWIKEMDVRDGGIWGRVEWNDAGHNAIASKGYKYVSPVFTHTEDGQIVEMISAALTNQPNLRMAALNRESETKETTLDKALLEALGLKEGASTDDALTAINTLKGDLKTATNRAATPDPQKFVPRADYEAAQNTLKAFQEEAKARTETAINTALDAAIKAKKITPASRDYHLATCRQDGGLKRFEAMIKDAPVIVADSDLDGKTPPGSSSNSLSPDEKALCRSMGMTEDQFLKNKQAEEAAK